MNIKASRLADSFEAHNESTMYWTDGKAVYYRGSIIKNADIETFEQFPGAWGKDKNHCYSGGERLNNADPKSFTVLNFTYAKDSASVWTLVGRIAEADAATFTVCDDGRHSLGRKFERLPDKQIKRLPNGEIVWYELFVPYGFGKDKNVVYYYDFKGKTNIVKKANPISFVSLNDSYFGYDENFVFCGRSSLPKADSKTWKKLMNGYYYSKDCGRVYYFNRLIAGADAETFEIITVPSVFHTPYQYAKDKNQGYNNDNAIELSELENRIRQDTEDDTRYRKELGIYAD